MSHAHGRLHRGALAAAIALAAAGCSSAVGPRGAADATASLVSVTEPGIVRGAAAGGDGGREATFDATHADERGDPREGGSLRSPRPHSSALERVHFSGGDDLGYPAPYYGGYGEAGVPPPTDYFAQTGDPLAYGAIGVLPGQTGSPSVSPFVAGASPPPTRLAIRVQGDAAPALAGRRVLDRAYVPLRGCYEELVERDPAAAGSLVVSFVVGKDGKVEKGASATGTPSDGTFSSCITKTIGELTFATGDGESKLTATLDTAIPPPPPPDRLVAPVPTPPIRQPIRVDAE